MSYVLPYASRSVSRGGCSIPVRGPLRIEDELIHALDYLYSKGIVINRFHMTATTTGASETVSIARLTTYYNTTIDWGDGSAPETLVANVTTARTHVYATAGTYPITVNHAHLITQLRVDNAKLGGIDTAELKYSVLTYFWVTRATGCTINSSDMVNWRPANWHLYSMPAGTYSISSANMVDWRPKTWQLSTMPAAGTYSISSANMVDWRPTYWQLSTMPAAGSSYTFAASCMRAWTSTESLKLEDLGLLVATVDAILMDIYAGLATFTAAAPTLTIGGTNAAPSGIYQDPPGAPASGLEAVWEMTHDDKPWTVAATGGSYLP